MKLLEGQTAIVTGAGRGIGKAIAKELAECGANMVLNYVTSAQATEEMAHEFIQMGLRAITVKANVADFQEAQNLIKAAHDEFGQIDVLVNNAGITRDKTLKNMSFEQWEEVIHTNLNSVFNCTRSVIPLMLDRKYGRVVSISSFVAQAGNIGQANYSATKAGIIGFTKSVALEVGRHGITVNAVCPGFTESDMLWSVPENIRTRILERIPMGRFGKPEEVAHAVRFIVAEAGYMTGQAININGGVYI